VREARSALAVRVGARARRQEDAAAALTTQLISDLEAASALNPPRQRERERKGSLSLSLSLSLGRERGRV
jgi:hypothetical protein